MIDDNHDNDVYDDAMIMTKVRDMFLLSYHLTALVVSLQNKCTHLKYCLRAFKVM